MTNVVDVPTFQGPLAPVALEAAQQYWPCRRDDRGSLCVRVDDMATVHIHCTAVVDSPANRPLGIPRDDSNPVGVFTLPIVRDLKLTENLLHTTTFQGRQFPRVGILVQPDGSTNPEDETSTVRVVLEARAYLATLAPGEAKAILLDLAHAANTVRGLILQTGDGSPYSVRVPPQFKTIISIDGDLLDQGEAECPLPTDNLSPDTTDSREGSDGAGAPGGIGPVVDHNLLRLREWTLEEAQRQGMQEMNVLLLAQVLAKRDPKAFRRIFEVDSIPDVLAIDPEKLKVGGDTRVDSMLKQVDWDWNGWELFAPRVLEQLKVQCPDLVDLVREEAGWVRRDGGPRPTGRRGFGPGRRPTPASPAQLRAKRRPDADDIKKPAPKRSELEAALKQRVHGQDEAIEAISARVAMAKRGLDGADSTRPDGVFLFAGPTGVGKTELAKALADTLCGEGDNLITLDMSEYHRDWAVSRLVGPMPGYIGSDRPDGWLTTKIINNPRSVLLLDEFEKAHPSVWQVFLQVFDEGRLTDGSGATADFKDVVVILTSNMGARDLTKNEVGFIDTGADAQVARDEARKREVVKTIKDTVPPELFNRIDRSVVFGSLDDDLLLQITEGKLGGAVDDLAKVGYKLKLGRGVASVVAAADADPALGARPVNRAIDRLIREPLADLEPGNYSVRALKTGKLKFTKVKG